MGYDNELQNEREGQHHDEPPAPRAGERGKWRVVNFAKDGANEWMVVTGIGRTVALANTSDTRQAEREMRQIANDHNQHAILIEQQERLIDAIRDVAIRSLFYCEQKYDHDDQARLNLEALLATIEREGMQ